MPGKYRMAGPIVMIVKTNFRIKMTIFERELEFGTADGSGG